MSTNPQKSNTSRPISPVEMFFYRSPFSVVTLVSRIKGTVSQKHLNKAVAKAAEKHINLRVRVRVDENQMPWFTTEGAEALPVEIIPQKEEDDWIRVVQQANQTPFEFETYPAIRIILVQSANHADLVIVCHHTICDGLSLAYLTRDLLTFLGNPDQAVKILPDPVPISLENLPADVSQNSIAKFFINRINQQWMDDKIHFDQEDYRTITKSYWQTFNHQLLPIMFSETATSDLVARCRKEETTVNSAITAAFAGAQRLVQGAKATHSRTVVASNLRDRIPSPPGEGVGMFAGGVELNFKYNPKRTFWENARNFHKQVASRYVNKNLFKEALTWCYLEPSISEAMNYKKIGGLVPADSRRYEKLYTFSQREDVIQSILKREKLDTFGSIIMGTAVTNLTHMDFPRQYGDLELERMIFKPGGAFPLSNVNLLVGVVTCSGKMSLLLEYLDRNIDVQTMEKIKDKALTFLMKE